MPKKFIFCLTKRKGLNENGRTKLNGTKEKSKAKKLKNKRGGGFNKN